MATTTAKTSHPVCFKRELHFPSVESILYLEPDARYRSMPFYRPSKVFRYHPYPQYRQRYVTVDEDMRVLSDEREEDFRVIFGPYILYPINTDAIPPLVQPLAPPPGRIRRLAAWLLNHLLPNAA